MASTRTYVSLVNDALNEAGESLATFNTGGSDFTTQTDSMMNKFKTWTSRAWRDVQQECFDWEFMSEQGLCNIDPGVMFYTDGTAVSAFNSALSPGATFSGTPPTSISSVTFNIYDQDGTVAIPSVSSYLVKDLTGTATLTSPFGYFNLSGFSVTNPINVALKPGAEYFTATKTTYSSVKGSTINGTVTGIDSTGDLIVVIGPGAFGTSQVIFYGALLNLTSTGSSPNLNVSFDCYNANVLAALTNPGVTSFHIGTYVNGAPAGGINLTGGGTFPSNISTVTGATSKAFIHSWKSFNFDEETQTGDFQETIEEITPSSFRCIDYLNSAPQGEVPVPFMAWETFRSSYDVSSAYPGLPRLVSEDDMGRYRFYPAPYYTVSMKFDYVRKPQILSAYNDIPRGVDDNYMDIIMWRTLIYYGEFQEQPSTVARARKRYNDLLARLEQKNREKPHFKPHKLW